MAAQTPVSGCPHHSGMRFIYVCKSCVDQLLCIYCVAENHNGHKVGTLNDYVAGQKLIIQQYVDNISKPDIPNTEGDFQESGRGYQKNTEDIKRQRKQMKHVVDNTVDMLVRMCTELEQRHTAISERNKTALTKHLREDLRPKLDRCQEVLTSGTTVDVTTLAREIRNTSDPAPATLRSLQTVEFKPGTTSTELLKRMLGKLLVDGVDRSNTPGPKCVVLHKFTMGIFNNMVLPLGCCYDTCRTCVTGDEAWVSCLDTDRVYRVDINGKVKEKIKCKVNVQSISVSPSTGRVWFCVVDDHSIREITTGGDIVTHFNVDKRPWSLCVTSDDMIVVGMMGGIQLYTTDGRVVSAGAGGPCRQVAVWPHHMASCTVTGDVAAVDRDGVYYHQYMADKTSNKQPCVIVMDKHLNLKFHCKDIGTFYPYDVSFDGVGDVLVSEHVTKSVLLIDINTGHYMRTVYTSDGDIPLCIGLHDNSILWVGHRDTDKMKIIKYK